MSEPADSLPAVTVPHTERFERRVAALVLACTLLAPVLALLAP